MKVRNPSSVHPPTGNYSHGIEMPPNCRTLYIAGQTGLRADGTTPAPFEEQCEVVWQNIRAITADAGMKLTDIVKLTVLLTDAAQLPKFAEVRKRYLGAHKPAVTGLVVKALVRPEWLIEVEAIAAVPARTPPRRGAKRPARRSIRRPR